MPKLGHVAFIARALICAGLFFSTAVWAAGTCTRITEVSLGGFGDAAFAKKFTQRFGPKKKFGAVREDTHLRYIGNFQTKKRCNLPKVYFSSLHYIESSDFILLEHLAGSESKVALWDIVQCKEIWNGSKFGATGQPVWYRDKEIVFRPTCWDCNSKPADEPCACDAAIAIKMKPNCEFVPDPTKSAEITKKEIGASFTGNKKVIHRFTPQAQVVK